MAYSTATREKRMIPSIANSQYASCKIANSQPSPAWEWQAKISESTAQISNCKRFDGVRIRECGCTLSNLHVQMGVKVRASLYVWMCEWVHRGSREVGDGGVV